MKFLQILFASELCVITFSYALYHGRHKERKKPHGEKDLPKEKSIKKAPTEQNNLVIFSKGAIHYSCPPSLPTGSHALYTVECLCDR